MSIQAESCLAMPLSRDFSFLHSPVQIDRNRSPSHSTSSLGLNPTKNHFMSSWSSTTRWCDHVTWRSHKC